MLMMMVPFHSKSGKYIDKCLGIDPAHARASFDALDTNNDGVISEEEFRAYHWEFFCTTENKLNSEIMYGPLE